jgi:hypothetical protein
MGYINNGLIPRAMHKTTKRANTYAESYTSLFYMFAVLFAVQSFIEPINEQEDCGSTIESIEY